MVIPTDVSTIMEAKVVSNSTLRRRAQRDLKRTLQQISDDCCTNLPVNTVI